MSKPVLYQFAISPACQRVFAVMAHKGIDYDTVEVDISQKQRPAEFTRVSPFGKVPVLEHDGNLIIDSNVIMQYLNDVWPEPPMMPVEPVALARARRWLAWADRELLDKDARFTHVETDRDRKRALAQELLDGVHHLDAELAGVPDLFCGKALSLVDCALAPALAFLPIWSSIIGDTRYAGYTHVQAYTARLRQNDTLAANVFNIPAEVYEGFFTAVLEQGITVP